MRRKKSLFCSYIKSNFISKLNNSDYRIYVTSDHHEIELQAAKNFDCDKLVFTGGDSIHFLEITQCQLQVNSMVDYFYFV